MAQLIDYEHSNHGSLEFKFKRGHVCIFYLFFCFIYIYIYIKPLKSEAIHETGLSGNVVASFFPLIIYIYILGKSYF